jgi:hypothetical protein
MDPPAVVAQALFDLEADPGELVDVSAERPDLVLALGEELARYLEQVARWGTAAHRWAR